MADHQLSVAIVADTHGGYWELGADGGIFALGGAPFLGLGPGPG